MTAAEVDQVLATLERKLTERLVESSGDGILAFDTACRYTVWNPGMERIAGMRSADVLGRVAFEIFPFLVETGEDRHFHEALAGRSSVSANRAFEIPATRKRGFFEGHYSPLHDAEGRVIGGLGIIRDVTERILAEEDRIQRATAEAARAEAEAAARRFAFLAEAGEVLSSSLDFEQTLRDVARLAVPILGDACVVDVVERGARRRIASEPAGAAALLEGSPPGARLELPLIARGVELAVLILGRTSRPYDEIDRAFATDLARRAALAADNARLHGQLRLSEQRFRAVTEQSPLSTQIFDAGGKTIQVNRAWEELWGVTIEAIEGWNVLRDPQLESRGIAGHIARAFGGEATRIPAIRYDPEETLPNRSKNADPARWVRAFAYPIKDGEGAVREVVLVHEDVTSQVHSEEQLRSSEERLRLALAASRTNVWEWDLATDRVECSENARELWGIDVGHVNDFLTVVHPEDRDLLLASAEKTRRGDARFESVFRLITPEGSLRWVQSRGQVDRRPDGSVERIIGATVDITPRKLAETTAQVLADAGETLGSSLDPEKTLNGLAQVIVPRIADWCAVDLIGEDGALDRVAVFHRDPRRVALAKELFVRYPPRRDAPRGAWHVIQTGEPEWAERITEEQIHAAARDPEQLSILLALELRSYVVVPLIARGHAIGALTVVHAESRRLYQANDVALLSELARRAATAVDNARLYQRLREEDRLKDDFLATLAHELRNPLAPLRSGLEVLRVSPPGAPTERTRAIMERQLAHMVRLIDDLLDVSRVTRGKISLQLEAVEVTALIGAAVEVAVPALEEAGLRLTLRLPDAPLAIRGDRTRLAQVLSNLLNNAVKYTPRGGSIEVSAEGDAGDVVMRVRDDGMGIPRDMLARVFDMFTQVDRGRRRADGGLGIGLTLVRRLVELHGGRVWAESDGLDQGTTVVMRLPAAGAPAADHRADPRPTIAPASQPRRVLVVDDNADAAETLALLLESVGHVVRTAGSGSAALEVVREFVPEVAFLDIGLPGMSGYELASALRRDPRLAAAKLVALTGWGQADDRRQSRDAGFDHHLTKPAETSEVLALLSDVGELHP